LKELSAIYPMVFHCVGFNLGSVDSLDRNYLSKIKKLADEFNPAWISDHLCFCGSGGHYSPDLLPISHNKKMLKLIAEKIHRIMDFLQCPFLVENVSYYVKFKDAEFTEEEFLYELALLTDCHILLDVNNLYVNGKNHVFDPYRAFLKLPIERIKQMHMAGHTDYGSHIVDTHAEPIAESVFNLFRKIIKKTGKLPVCVERDENIPPFSEIKKEMKLLEKTCLSVENDIVLV
ncbi:MAG: DUF692 domain-containing protein, partial [Halobacteriovoraceae bacterium]|nr:DUF692 domain-containing protein [Halobacteriovoraceae bacterium]